MLCPAAGCDDRFRNDLRILLRPRPACQIVRVRHICVHVLVDEIQQVVAVTARRIAQV